MKIHFSAIAGTGMGSLAGLLKAAGHDVRGSDQAIYPPMSTQLAELGIEVFEGYRAENLDWQPELVVVGNTCKADHVELLAAQARGFRLASFPQLLAETFLAERHSIVIAGTHGKTTTTSLVAHLLRDTGNDPGYLIGGIPLGFERSFEGGRPPYFVVEGDEYDSATFDKRPKFVHYLAKTAVITSLEYDHADIYPSLEKLRQAFAMLVNGMPADGRLIVCADAEIAVELAEHCACTVETYCVREVGEPAPARCDWLGRYRVSEGAFHLSVERNGQLLFGEIALPLTGAYNMANCLAATAVTVGNGINAQQVALALQRFAGVRRRQEVRATVNGVTIIDDFAHHPTAIAETLGGLRRAYPGQRLIAVFEPRSGSSRRNVFQREFALALAQADHAIVAPLYAPEKIPADQRLDLARLASDLSNAGVSHRVGEGTAAIIDHLVDFSRSGDLIVVMSCGGFESLIERLTTALSNARR
ncbi:MAG: UDP-N-acetylmuramate:L-alanyl-gamma-D-glutamyl-meso-diaminopimelate ligase [Deltaproteobacteria bacterium]|nr:UDP-N-acetylmuramate:L-alanyl-gamma-D-glutamyl-meso-diaminopimelate ligase [Deltaproteobacteria bacterium]